MTAMAEHLYLPLCFLKCCFSNLFCFTLLLQKSTVCMDTVFYGRIRFWSRAATFDHGLANWSCISRSVKGEMSVCMVSAF